MRRHRLLVAAGLLLAACSTEPVLGGGDTVIRVLRSPINPVEMPGVNNSAPVEGAQVSVLRNGRAVAGGATDAAGLLRLQLGTGTFEARVTTCPGAIALPAPVSFTAPLEAALVSIECDTGIR